MIRVFKKIWQFSGEEKGNIKKSIVLGFLQAMFNAAELWAIYTVLQALINKNHEYKVAWVALGFMIVSIVGKISMNYFSQLQRTHAGYFMVANKRVQIGDKLKFVPMGYFNNHSLGNITGISTTILTDVENAAPVVLVRTLGGFINSVVFTIFVLLFDWRIGLIVLSGMLLFLFFTALQEKKSRYDAPKRQKAQESLVDAVLETIQGMTVVKAFNLEQQVDKKIDKAIESSCMENMSMEKSMTPYMIFQQLTLKLFSVLIILTSIMFYLKGNMLLVDCLMMLIFSFMVFEQLEVAGHGIGTIRLTENSIDRANTIEDVPVMDEGAKDITPKNFDIEMKNVSFAYEKRPILKNVSLKIKENTMTAVIGPSGSGKTTLCNLISRFWDADGGVVSIGGYNVQDYTLDSLMSNISMVFQNVYLFEDTIENNIKFGSPNATREEVVKASKKACCHEFISKLPNGYDTVIGEGGSSISGGEKQRISIARAMLKDSPIVILDEATANVDPENEDRLQSAIEELTKNKTIIMIAHRLKTVRHADQILVLDKGKIVQRGTHHELINKKGIYSNFVSGREESIGWKLAANE